MRKRGGECEGSGLQPWPDRDGHGGGGGSCSGATRLMKCWTNEVLAVVAVSGNHPVCPRPPRLTRGCGLTANLGCRDAAPVEQLRKSVFTQELLSGCTRPDQTPPPSNASTSLVSENLSELFWSELPSLWVLLIQTNTQARTRRSRRGFAEFHDPSNVIVEI